MEDFKIDMPLGAQTIINTLWREGFEAYLVGGCVRDYLRGVYPKDWDICTNAVPEEVKHALRDYKIYDTGLKHGTVTVVVAGEPYEVTTYRIDGGYADHRHPDNVQFTPSLNKDLERRDFTINAMAYSPITGLIDPNGGWTDLQNQIIRCVGDPDARFQEDALRIMRAMRFASTMQFRIEGYTAGAMLRQRKLLDAISRERVRDELCKFILGHDARYVAVLHSEVIGQIIPEFWPCFGFEQNNPYHDLDVFGHIMKAVEKYEGEDLVIKLALLFHDIGKPKCYTEDEKGGHFRGHAIVSYEMTKEIMERLRFDNQTKNDVLELVLYHDAEIKPTPRVVRKWLNRIGEKQFRRLIQVNLADIQAHAPGTQGAKLTECIKVFTLLTEAVEQQQCFSMKDLRINGRDIMGLGVLEGPEVGKILNYLLNEVIEGNIENSHDELMEAAICRLVVEGQC